jgi:formate hydrogenlyase subunit 3/multisubunit Na+/H+ antiporter MnhD subunit
VLRFLKFITFSVPFILFTGWLLTGVEANPGNFNLVFRSGLLLGLGFTFLLGVFPFHSWIAMLAKEAHPYAFGFLTFFLPSFALIFGFGFFDRYAWLRENQDALPVLVLAGALMVLIAGLWAAYERDLGRLFAFAAMLNIGFGLQAVGLGASGVQVFFALLLPSAFAFWIWAVASSILANENSPLDLETLRKASTEHPLATVALLLALFSLAGLPLLGSFPGRLALFDGVATSAPWSTVMSLVGSLGLLLAGVRTLKASLPESETVKREWVEEAHPVKKPTPSKDLSNPYMWAFVAVAAVSLLGFGLLPRLFLGAIPNLASMFSLLVP